jgi:hypothetical protein
VGPSVTAAVLVPVAARRALVPPPEREGVPASRARAARSRRCGDAGVGRAARVRVVASLVQSRPTPIAPHQNVGAESTPRRLNR